MAAEDDVAELVLAQRAHAVHHPAHAEPGADLLGLPGAGRSRADHFLQRDHVGVDVAQHLDDARRLDAAVHAAAAVDVVGGDPDVSAQADRSLLALQDPDERPDDLFPERPPLPRLERDLRGSPPGRVRSPATAAPRPPGRASRGCPRRCARTSGCRCWWCRAPPTGRRRSRILACIIAGWYSKMRTPAASSCPHIRRLASRTQC